MITAFLVFYFGLGSSGIIDALPKRVFPPKIYSLSLSFLVNVKNKCFASLSGRQQGHISFTDLTTRLIIAKYEIF